MSLREGCVLPLTRYVRTVVRRDISRKCASHKASPFIRRYSFSEEETFGIDSVKKHLGTPACEVSPKHNVTFEIDTGTSCNILPFAEYVKATSD